MKKTIIALATLMATMASYGQGTVQFNNRLTASGIDAPVFLAGGNQRVSDPSFKAQIYATSESALSSLTPVFPTTTFRTGNAAGYVNPIDVSIPGILPGAKAWIVVRVYDGATFESSAVFGTTNPILITLGGVGIPPSPPAPLIGLASITIPDPSTIALALLGAAILLSRRWLRS